MKYQKESNFFKSHLKLHQKIPRNKFNQGGGKLYAENCKTLIKETEDDSKKWKAIPCSWIRRSSIVKVATYYPKQSTDLMQSLSKYL